MSNKPPHLDDAPEEEAKELNRSFKKIGRQGPSKYGKGGARAHKAKDRADRAKRQ